MKEKIFHFWKCSINNDMDKFNFESFFLEFENKIRYKLCGHGQISFYDYLKFISKYYNLDVLKQFTYVSKHTGYKEDYEDILKNLFHKRYEHFNKRFKDSEIYKNITNVYNKVLDRDSLTRRGMVYLVDECINLQHNSGFIIDEDISKLREEFENGNK